MRIDAFNRVAQLYQNNSTKKVAKTGQLKQTDRVEISRAGRDYQIAKAAVEKAPEVREDVVADIRERMANGSYQIDVNALADKLLNGYVC